MSLNPKRLQANAIELHFAPDFNEMSLRAISCFHVRRHRIAVAAVENGVSISKEEFLERRVGFRDTRYIDLGRYYVMAAEEGGVCSVGKVVRNASHLEEKRKAAEAGLVIPYGVVPGKSIGEKVPIEYSHVIIDGDEECESCSQMNYATVPEPNAALLLLIGLAGLSLRRRGEAAVKTCPGRGVKPTERATHSSSFHVVCPTGASKNAKKPYKIGVGWGLKDEKDTRKY